MKCLECGKEFVERTVIQKYCSKKCGDIFRKTHKILSPSITFRCAKCGKLVVTEDGTSDKRSRFCSAVCEKKYWRHPPYEFMAGKVNFHSINEYLNWEKRTND